VNRVVVIHQCLTLLLAEQVHFIHHVQTRFISGLQLAQHLLDLRHLFGGCRARRVGHVQQQRRPLYFFERRAESRNQRMRKISDEPHGV
jgi:hypothetical protein